MNSLSELQQRIDHVNFIISNSMPKSDADLMMVTEAMHYSVLSGGKRLRAIYLLEAFRLFNSDKDLESRLAAPFAAALEFVHAYSLVHDDLPAMDNDTYRRGQLTTHAKYGHANGILTGDALLNYSIEIISNALCDLGSIRTEYARELYIRASKAQSYLYRFAGYSGMIGGQYLDVNHSFTEEGSELTKMKLKLFKLYDLKTSGLFKAAFCIGGVLGGADEVSLSKLETIGYHIGLAFQIKDDILDITSTSEQLGKDTGNDEKNNKQTIASLFGIEEAQRLVQQHSDAAIALFDELGGNTAFLKELTLFLVNRNK